MKTLLAFLLLVGVGFAQITTIPTTHYPYYVIPGSGFNGLTIDTADEKVAAVFTVPKTGTLKTVVFRTAAVTTGDTLRVSFQDLDSGTGRPDGTADQYRDVVIADTDDNVHITAANITSDGTDLGVKRAVTAGQTLAAVVAFQSRVGGVLQIAEHGVTGQALSPDNVMWCQGDPSCTWAARTNSVAAMVLIYDDDSVAVTHTSPYHTSASSTIGQNNELGMKFQLPVSMRVSGAWAWVGGSGAMELRLYDNADTLLASKAFIIPGYVRIKFSSITITAGQAYRLVAVQTTATAANVVQYTTSSNSYLAAWMGTVGWIGTYRPSAGSWTDYSDRMVPMGLIIDGVATGSSGAVGYVY